jgi:hypothetical protein
LYRKDNENFIDWPQSDKRQYTELENEEDRNCEDDYNTIKLEKAFHKTNDLFWYNKIEAEQLLVEVKAVHLKHKDWEKNLKLKMNSNHEKMKIKW